MLVAGPLASFIPLSTLAGVLVVVCWNMAEKEDFLLLLRDWRGGSVLIATYGLTLIEDLPFGISEALDQGLLRLQAEPRLALLPG